ncbi:8180_t:CDS:1, partial [Cetraspora pellucida]
SCAWAKYFIPILWSNATREFDVLNTGSIKLWKQLLKCSIYYDDNKNSKKPPMFNYLEYIEELSLNAIDLYFYKLKNNLEYSEAQNKSMIIRRNVIKHCRKLKYLDNGIIWINDDDWKKNRLDILFTKIGSMTHVVFTQHTNLKIKEMISLGLQVKSIEYKNYHDEKTQNQLNFLGENTSAKIAYLSTSDPIETTKEIFETIKSKNSIKEI